MKYLDKLVNRFSIASDIEFAISQNQIKISKIQFPERCLDSIFCYQVTGAMDGGKIANGLGADYNSSRAIIKAYVEFVERSVFLNDGGRFEFDSTNGIAGHRFSALARKAAVSEIYERDSFLLHWYSATPMELIKPPGNLIKTIENLRSVGYTCMFFKSFLGVIPTVSCFLVDETSGGFVLGLSSGKSLNADIEKSFTEAVINLYFGSYGRSDQELIAEIKSNGITQLEHHRAYWLLIDHFPDWLLSKSAPSESKNTTAPPGAPIEIFRKKFKKVTVVGCKVRNSLGIGLGPPDLFEIETMKNRFTYDIGVFLPQLGERPHPIP